LIINTCDNLVDTSIKTIKYLNGPHNRWMGQKISPWICYINLGDSIPILASYGLITNLSWDQAAHENSLN
jgi:hypothetical protein